VRRGAQTANARFVSVRTLGLHLPHQKKKRRTRAAMLVMRTKRVKQVHQARDAGARNPNLLSKVANPKGPTKRIGQQERLVKKWVKRAVPRQAVQAVALAARTPITNRG